MKYNILEVASLQPDYVGFIFYKKSPRDFSGEIPTLPKKIKKVGVFVNATIEEIIKKVNYYKLNVVQLHGDENDRFCNKLKQGISANIEIWKVFGIGKNAFDFSRLATYETSIDAYLFDTKGQKKGGNGYKFNWDVLKTYPYKTPFILSGGIGIEELTELDELLQTGLPVYGIDVNSRFETKPGLKDVEKLKEFMNQL